MGAGVFVAGLAGRAGTSSPVVMAVVAAGATAAGGVVRPADRRIPNADGGLYAYMHVREELSA